MSDLHREMKSSSPSFSRFGFDSEDEEEDERD